MGVMLAMLLGCMAVEEEGALVVTTKQDLEAPSDEPVATPSPVAATPRPTPTPFVRPTEPPFEIQEPDAPGGPSQTPDPVPTVDPVTRDPEEGGGEVGSTGDEP